MTYFDVSIFGENAKKIQEILGLHEEQEIFIDGKLAVKYRSIEGHSKIEIKIELPSSDTKIENVKDLSQMCRDCFLKAKASKTVLNCVNCTIPRAIECAEGVKE